MGQPEEPTTAQQLAHHMRKGMAQFRMYEHGAALADRLMAVEQEVNDRSRELAAINEKLAEGNRLVEAAHQEAADIKSRANAEADKIFENARNEAKKEKADADAEIEVKRQAVVSLDATIEEREDTVETLDASIAEKKKEIDTLNASIADGKRTIEQALGKLR